MSKRRPFLLPWEPEYTAHRQAQRRRDQVRASLERSELRLQKTESPSIAPDHLHDRERTHVRVRLF